jgi:teichuronic acid exporter
MLIVAFIVAAFLFLSAGYIADFYNEVKLVYILQLLSLNIFISPFGALIITMLRRNLDFKPIVLVGMLSQIISISTMIYFGYNGAAELALVYGAITNSVCNFIFIQFYRPANLPKLPGTGKIIDILHYAKYVSAASIIGQLGHQASSLVVGKHFTLEDVGQLDRANNTAALFNQLIIEGLNPVLTPYISRLNRENQDIRTPLRELTNILLNLAWPFYALLALIAEPAVALLYGEQWVEAALYLSIFCIGRMSYFCFQHIDAILLGKGLVKENMRIQLILNITRIIVILVFVNWGITTMLIAVVSITSVIRTAVYLSTIDKHLKINKEQFLLLFIKPLTTTLLTITPVLFCFLLLDFDWGTSYFTLFLSLSASAIVWAVCNWNQEIGKLVKPVIYSKIKFRF